MLQRLYVFLTIDSDDNTACYVRGKLLQHTSYSWQSGGVGSDQVTARLAQRTSHWSHQANSIADLRAFSPFAGQAFHFMQIEVYFKPASIDIKSADRIGT
ncbi:hypothetical protein D9M68_912450 [compost metagenome]